MRPLWHITLGERWHQFTQPQDDARLLGTAQRGARIGALGQLPNGSHLLLDGMKRLLLALVALCGVAVAAPSASLCSATERVAFSCSTWAGKQISVCSTGKIIQYRFGRPGRVELEYPRNEAFLPSSFEYYHYFRPGVDRASLTFATAEAEYTVFSDADGQAMPSGGVSIRLKLATRSQSIPCSGPLFANWNEVVGKVECSADALNSCER